MSFQGGIRVTNDLQQLGDAAVAMAIGAVVGLERQYMWQRDSTESGHAVAAGVRTFTLFALAGAVTAMLTPALPYAFSVGLLVVGALSLAGYVVSMREAPGLTTELAQVLVFLLGGLCGTGRSILASACAVAIWLVLSMKERLHRLTARLEREDLEAALKFAIVSVLILPLLPVEPWSPFAGVRVRDLADPTPWWHEVSFSPRRVWYLVVMISGVSFVGYGLSKILGPARGIFVTALVGGLASSTATSLAFAQRSVERPELSPELAEGVVIANAVMPARLLVLIFAVSPALAARLTAPLMVMSLTSILVSFAMRRFRTATRVASPELKNPFRLGPAVKFGALYATMLVAVQVGSALFGEKGLYAISALGGLVDTDAIALAMAKLVARATQPAAVGAIAVVVAVLSNMVFKSSVMVAIGDRQLGRSTLVAFLLVSGALVAGFAVQQTFFG